MAARAMWKAQLCIGNAKVPVKLYSAIEDRSVHFRLLHKKDHAPVRQAMVNPETDEVVPRDKTERGYISAEGNLVKINEGELNDLQPDPSRVIQVKYFLPPDIIDHRYYRRPYYLGPDGNDDKYADLISALHDSGKEGFAEWVMRGKSYIGALRLYQGYPILITLRHAEEVIAVSSVEAPSGKELDKREMKMSRQLIEMLEADFEPEEYSDEYRQQVMDLIKTKASGGKVKGLRSKGKKPVSDLSEALEASLKKEPKRA